MRRIFWKRVISGMQLAEGYRIPRGWGVSYRELESDHLVIHLLPLNYIIAAARWLLLKLRLPYFVELETKRMDKEWLSGWDDGWDAKTRQIKDTAGRIVKDARYIDGCIDELAIFDKALTNNEIENKVEEYEKAKRINEKNKSDGL